MAKPSNRSAAYLRNDGWYVEKVERWCAHSRRRIDLFGFADLVAMKDGERVLLVQETSGSNNLTERRRKIAESPLAAMWLRAGNRIQIHVWRKLKVKRGGKAFRWVPRVIEIEEAPCPIPHRSSSRSSSAS